MYKSEIKLQDESMNTFAQCISLKAKCAYNFTLFLRN